MSIWVLMNEPYRANPEQTLNCYTLTRTTATVSESLCGFLRTNSQLTVLFPDPVGGYGRHGFPYVAARRPSSPEACKTLNSQLLISQAIHSQCALSQDYRR